MLTDRRSSNPGRPVTIRTFENTVAILGSVMEDPNLSTRRRAAALNIDRGTLMKILKDLKQWPYRYTLHQGLIAAANDRCDDPRDRNFGLFRRVRNIPKH